MKKILLAFTALACIFSFSAVYAAEDGKVLYGSCRGCHGQAGETGLKGQSADAVVEKLEGYKAGTYGGARKQVMVNFASRLSDEQMEALGAYIATF